MQQILTSDADRAVMAVKGISAAGYALLVGSCPESHAPRRKRMPSRMPSDAYVRALRRVIWPKMSCGSLSSLPTSGSEKVHCMRRLATIVALALIALTSAAQGYAEEDRGSAGYLVVLCKTYLDLVEKEAETLQNLGRTEPARLTAAGVCVGFVVGVLETLRSVNLSCIPKDISNAQLVRTVLNEIENHPERMRQDFGVSVRAAMMKWWPCRKKKGPRLISRPKR
jgi:hypothetical protein